MKKPVFAKASTGEVRKTLNCLNLNSRALPDEAHQNEKPTFANAMVGEVGKTGFEPATLPTQVGMRYQCCNKKG